MKSQGTCHVSKLRRGVFKMIREAEWIKLKITIIITNITIFV